METMAETFLVFQANVNYSEKFNVIFRLTNCFANHFPSPRKKLLSNWYKQFSQLCSPYFQRLRYSAWTLISFCIMTVKNMKQVKQCCSTLWFNLRLETAFVSVSRCCEEDCWQSLINHYKIKIFWRWKFDKRTFSGELDFICSFQFSRL